MLPYDHIYNCEGEGELKDSCIHNNDSVSHHNGDSDGD